MLRLFVRVASVVCVLGALALAPLRASAQDVTTGSIAGRLLDDQQLPVPGATVTLTSAQGSRRTQTGDRGEFLFLFLTPGSYNLAVELQGFQRLERPNVQVRLGQRAFLALTMTIGAMSEVVQVTGAAPVLDTKSATTGANIGNTLMYNLPVGRNFASLVPLAPGVASGGDPVLGQNFSISGGSGLENNYILDGVNITNTGYGTLGSYSIVYGSLGTAINFDYIQEVQVKTGGFDAEFGQATGGVVNVVTKSGTNAFKGSGYSYFTLSPLEGTRKLVALSNGYANDVKFGSNDGGFTLGGPIRTDRMFFFGAFNPQYDTTKRRAPAGFPLAALGDPAVMRHVLNYAGKWTWQESNRHRFEFSAFGDPSRRPQGPNRRTSLLADTTSQFSALNFGGNNQTGRWSGILSNTWFLEASFARASSKFEESFPTQNDLWQTTDYRTDPIRRTGGLGYYENNTSRNLQWNAKSTQILRAHELKYGVQYEDISYVNARRRTGPTGVSLIDGRTTSTGVQVQVRNDATLGGQTIYRIVRGDISNPNISTDARYFVGFAQDEYKVTDRITAKLGVRYEVQQIAGNYSSYTFKNNWGPRLGATWDFMGDGRSKVYGMWGRFFEKIPNDIAVRSLSLETTVSRADYYDAALTQPVPQGAGGIARFIALGSEPTRILPGTKSQYQSEALAGIERQVFEDLNVGARFIYRTLGRVLEDIQFNRASDIDAGRADFGEYVIANPTAALGPAWVDPQRAYKALELTAEKRFSKRWQLLGNYRLAKLSGNYEGLFRNDNGQSDPNITSLFDFPPNDPILGYQGVSGVLPTDRRHMVKLYGSYQLAETPLTLGAGFYSQSGTPRTALSAHPVYTNAGEVPLAPRGSLGRTPWSSTLDLHADYALELGLLKQKPLRLIADVFNVANAQSVTRYYDDTEITLGERNPDYQRALGFLPPRQIRLAVRFEF